MGGGGQQAIGLVAQQAVEFPQVHWLVIIVLLFLGGADFFQWTPPVEVTIPASHPADPPSPRKECVPVIILNDFTTEGTESFTLTLSTRQGGVEVDPSVTTIFIQDDD